MSDPLLDSSNSGVLYTEYSRLTAGATLASLWSYETRPREHGRRAVSRSLAGHAEYWLERYDPLLNTMLPGTHVSIVVIRGDSWATGHSAAVSTPLPRACVVGPTSRHRRLLTGPSVEAIGAVIAPMLTPHVLGVPASELVDQVVPLDALWPPDDVDRLLAAIFSPHAGDAAAVLRDELTARMDSSVTSDAMVALAARLILLHGGRLSIDQLARRHGFGRRHFGRRFTSAVGLPPKLFARITRFHSLVRTLLSTDVSQWMSVAPTVGFYDQAHMINEFRAFAGSPPTSFFRPYGRGGEVADVQLRGRPSEWVQPRS